MAQTVALTIAGSDSSGGAGIQADLKTFAAHKVYGASAITALTAQNTQGVTDIFPISALHVSAQIHAVFDDLDVKAVKIGMLGSAAIIDAVADSLERFAPAHVVLDPVMVATSGAALAEEGVADRMKTRLMPLADLITPNIFEAGVLSNAKQIDAAAQMMAAAQALIEMGAKAVLVTGGDLGGAVSADLLHDGKTAQFIEAARIDTENTHGSGCTLSSAIAANLALGADLEQAVRRAKDYVGRAIKGADKLEIGRGRGPLDHFADLS